MKIAVAQVNNYKIRKYCKELYKHFWFQPQNNIFFLLLDIFQMINMHTPYQFWSNTIAIAYYDHTLLTSQPQESISGLSILKMF